LTRKVINQVDMNALRFAAVVIRILVGAVFLMGSRVNFHLALMMIPANDREAVRRRLQMGLPWGRAILVKRSR
jgi:hypothetical protein